MKKFVGVLIALALVLAMLPLAAFAEGGTTLYLVPGEGWLQSGARFTAYFFGNGEAWVDCTDADGDGTYECVAPAGYTNVIFCRMNPATTENNWDNKWNQTVDLTIGEGDLFTITNPWDEASEWKATGEWSSSATQSAPATITLVDGVSQSITVPAGGSVNVVVDATSSDMTLEVSNNGTYWEWYVQAGMWPTYPGRNGVAQVQLPAGDVYTVPVYNSSTETDQILSAVAKAPVAGTMDNPAELVIGENSAEVPGYGDAFWYTWTATENGDLTIAIDTAKSSDWTFSYVLARADGTYAYGDNHFSDDEPVVSFETLAVSAGDVIQIPVGTASYAPATVVINASFVPGSGSNVPGDSDNTGDNSGDNNDEASYVVSEVTLNLGNNTLTLDSSATTTLYEFTPDEVGVYTFTASNANALVGDWNNTGYPWDKTENKTNTLEWTCTGVGQSVLVGVSGVESTDLNVGKTGDYTPTTIDWTVYENTADLKDYELPEGNLVKVDVTDDKADAAVLGEDGYYHLNTADGPILLVWLGDYDTSNNPIGPNNINIINAAGLGRVSYVETDADGKIVEAIDYTNAVLAYAEVADGGYYPLTADLIEIYQNFGSKQGWYDDDVLGFYLFEGVEVDPETAWLFCCYYVESVDNGEDVVLSDYRVVGDAEWLGKWDPANESGRMVEVSENVYKITYKNVAAGDYEFKITKGSWAENWGVNGPNGDNVKFSVKETSDVTITFNAATGEISVAVNGEEIPKTSDAGMACLIVLMVLASTVAVVCTKKKFF